MDVNFFPKFFGFSGVLFLVLAMREDGGVHKISDKISVMDTITLGTLTQSLKQSQTFRVHKKSLRLFLKFPSCVHC